MIGAATMQICFKRVFPAHHCERSQLTGLPDKHNMLRSAQVLRSTVPTSCIAAECKLLSKACIRNHSTQQPKQCIAVHLTEYCKASASTYTVRLHSQFSCVAGSWDCMSSNRAARDKAAIHASVGLSAALHAT